MFIVRLLKPVYATQQENMNKGRLEAFSDGVLAIIITIMVLELAPPHVSDFAVLAEGDQMLSVKQSCTLTFSFGSSNSTGS